MECSSVDFTSGVGAPDRVITAGLGFQSSRDDGKKPPSERTHPAQVREETSKSVGITPPTQGDRRLREEKPAMGLHDGPRWAGHADRARRATVRPVAILHGVARTVWETRRRPVGATTAAPHAASAGSDDRHTKSEAPASLFMATCPWHAIVNDTLFTKTPHDGCDCADGNAGLCLHLFDQDAIPRHLTNLRDMIIRNPGNPEFAARFLSLTPDPHPDGAERNTGHGGNVPASHAGIRELHHFAAGHHGITPTATHAFVATTHAAANADRVKVRCRRTFMRSSKRCRRSRIRRRSGRRRR